MRTVVPARSIYYALRNSVQFCLRFANFLYTFEEPLAAYYLMFKEIST